MLFRQNSYLVEAEKLLIHTLKLIPMTTNVKPPVWFWVVSGVALLWNLAGVAAYLGQVTMTPETLSAMPENEQALYENVPAWATGAFAIAVFGGAFGCLALLLRKSWAIPLLIASLAGVVVQNVYSFFIANVMEISGILPVVMTILVIGIGIFLIWFARMSKDKGWIS